MTTVDLLRVMDEVSGLNVSEVFIPWIRQPCFPELLIKRLSPTTYELTQRCYRNQDPSLLWPIPVNFISAKGKVSGSFLMKERTHVL